MKQPLWIINSALLGILVLIIVSSIILQQKPSAIRKKKLSEKTLSFKKKYPPVKEETIREAIRSRFSARLAPANLKAFDLGYEKCRGAFS